MRDAIVRQNADLPGGNVTAGLREQSLRTIGRIVDPKSFNDLVVATVRRRAHPHPRHRLGRGRHQGAAHGRAHQRRAQRGPGGPAAVRREHRGRHRGGQDQPGSRWPRGCPPTSRPRSSAISRSTSTTPCTRSTCTWCWAASWPPWSCWPSCGACARPSSPRWPSRARSSPPSA